MSATNVDYYCAGFDKDGKRVGSIICDFNPEKDKNKDKATALIEKGKSLFNDAVTVEIITADDFDKYVSGGYIRGTDGKPAVYVAPEPTAEEKSASEKASLASEYEANKAEMLEALQSAQLAGNTDAIASIQKDYQDMTAAYKEAVEGVTTK